MAANIPLGHTPSPWAKSVPSIEGSMADGLDGAGSFAAGAAVLVPPNRALACFSRNGFSATLTGNYRNGESIALPAFPANGAIQIFSGSVFQSVAPSAADAAVAWFTIPDGPYPVLT